MHGFLCHAGLKGNLKEGGKMSENEKRGFTRRNFVKGSFAGAAVAASALGASSMFGCSPAGDKKGEGSAAEANETIAWSQ